MTNHSNPTDLNLQRLLDGELSADEALALEKDLLSDADANRRWQDFKRVDQALHAALASELAPHGEPLDRSVELRMPHAHLPRWSVAAVAAICLAVLAGAWLLTQDESAQPRTVPGGGIAAVDPPPTIEPAGPFAGEAVDTICQIDRVPVNIYNPETGSLRQIYVDYEQQTDIPLGREL